MLIIGWIYVTATAYTLHESPNKITASGIKPKQNITVAASRHLPMGARVYIPSRGWHIVQDRMSRRYDKMPNPRIDIYVDNPTEAKKWGKRGMYVFVCY